MADVIDLSTRRTDRENSAAPVNLDANRRATPVVSYALLLRTIPEKFQPEQVALDLLETGSNAAAAPVWAKRKAEFLALLHLRGQRGAAALALSTKWLADVTAAGVAEKARRRDEFEKFWQEEFGGRA